MYNSVAFLFIRNSNIIFFEDNQNVCNRQVAGYLLCNITAIILGNKCNI